MIVALAPFTVIPAPSAAAAEAALLASTMFKSFTLIAVELIMVCVPETVRLPPTVTSPVVVREATDIPPAAALIVTPARSILVPERYKSLNLLVVEPKL